jgi:septal ring factor EnvC (AmiA/AmiB activator)
MPERSSLLVDPARRIPGLESLVDELEAENIKLAQEIARLEAANDALRAKLAAATKRRVAS